MHMALTRSLAYNNLLQVATEFLNACAAGEADRVGFIVAHAQPSCLFTGLLLAASKGHKVRTGGAGRSVSVINA